MLFFNKLLPLFVLPLGWVLGLLIYGIVRRRRWPVIAAASVLYVCSMPVVGDLLARGLESRYPALPLSQVDKVDAIVPLGGIFGPPVAPGYVANVGEAGERLEAGIALWEHKKADWLVFTGGRMPWSSHAEVEGAMSKRAAVARGVPADKILVTREVGNTADEATAVAQMMRERGWSRIILVTSAWHMPRAARLFRKAGVNFVPFPVDFRVDRSESHTLLDFLPDGDGLHSTQAVLREWYGIAFYALTGR
jgi:uncharacterized SAM-binding protein YcdF (DUF218 family)